MKTSLKSYRFEKKEIETFLKYMKDNSMNEMVVPVIEERRVT